MKRDGNRETRREGEERAASAGPSSPSLPVQSSSIRAVRVGHGANCSSIGSVIDTLFATAVIGGAIFAAVAAALSREPVRVVGEKTQKRAARSETKDEGPS
jgi:hypothetical protein